MGMGNSTRCHAVIEELTSRGVRVHVLTSGNGLRYFAGRKEVASLHETACLQYSSTNGRVSGLRTMGSLLRHLRTHRKKSRDFAALLARLDVDAVVTDSEYATGPARKLGLPVIALNNSDVVVSEYLRGRPPASVRSHFWFVEYADYLFHKHCCSVMLSPTLRPIAPRHSRVRHIGLIVRREVREYAPETRRPFGEPRSIRRVVCMLSGSSLASDLTFPAQHPFSVDVVGRDGADGNGVTYHGKMMDNVPLLLSADALVVNGGFSAVSEALALNKPTIVVPVPGHAEQYVNARLVFEMGRGYVATAENALPLLADLHTRNEWTNLPPQQPLTGINGAAEAAELILAQVAVVRRHSG